MVWLITAAIIFAVLLALWITTLLSRRWFVTIKRSEETEVMVFHIRRIADAVERLATVREPLNQPSLDTSERSIGLSAFGR